MTEHAKPHAPLRLFETKVASEWVDYNGHMNDAAFAIVFSRSVDALGKLHRDLPHPAQAGAGVAMKRK